MEWIKTTYEFGRKLKNRYLGHEIGARSAQMTYYWILAFFPFLIMVMTLLSYTNIAEGEFMAYLNSVVPSTVMPLIQSTVNQLISYRSATLLSVGALVSIWSASAAVNVMIKGIHKAYSATDMRAFWVKKLVSIGYTFILLLLLVGMFVLLVFGNRIGESLLKEWVGGRPLYRPLWDFFRFSISVLGLLSGLYVIYRVVPRKHRKSSNVWPGTCFASIGWYSFSMLFSIYVDKFSRYNQMYGSIGGIFVLLIWLYTSGMVLLLGAEVNALWQDMRIIKKQKARPSHRERSSLEKWKRGERK